MAVGVVLQTTLTAIAEGVRPFPNFDCASFGLVRVLALTPVHCWLEILLGDISWAENFPNLCTLSWPFHLLPCPRRQLKLCHSLRSLLGQILFTEVASLSDGKKLTGFRGGYGPLRFAQTVTRQ